MVKTFGKLIDVPWEEVLELQSTGVRFVAVFIGDDAVSKSFESVLTAFLKSHSVHRHLVKVDVDAHAAQNLVVSYVPQIRMYEKGKEIHRHRGYADYAGLKGILL